MTRELNARQEAEKRHDAEEALRASERDFRVFFEMSGVGHVIAHARTGRFLRFNRHFCELTGYSENELLAMTSDNLTDPADLERDRAGWAAVVRAAGSFTIEKRYRRKDRGTIWVQVTSTLVRDEDGEPLHAVAVIRDVTDRHPATDEVRMTRRELEHALRQAAGRESRRIGQELHDHLCQHLLGAAFSAKALANHLDPTSPAAAEAGELARLINSAVQQTRDIVRGLNSAD